MQEANFDLLGRFYGGARLTYDESVSTLHFANKVKAVKVSSSMNEVDNTVPEFLEAVRAVGERSGVAGSVCTGAFFLGATGHLPPDETYDPAEAAAVQAIELDESTGEAHVAMALVRLFRDWDWPGAYEHFQKAISLTPGSAEVHQFYSMYLRTADEPEEALAEADAALQLDPLSSPIRLIHAEAVTSTGDLDRAETELQALLADDPSFRAAVESLGFVKARAGDVAGALELFERLPGLAGHRFAGAAVRGHAYGLLGRTDDAAAMIDLLHERAREQPEISIAMDLAIVYHGMGDLEAAVEQLHRAADVQAGGVVFVGSGNYWHTRSLRDAPGFDDFLDRIGYPKDGLGA